MNKILLVVVVVSVLVIFGLSLFHNTEVSQAKEEISAASIMNKLQEVTKNQQTIIGKLDEMKQELYIIKIRATR